MKFDADFGGARRAAVALRLFLCMASLALVPAAVIGYFSYLEARREIIDEKVHDMKQISKLRLGSVSTRIGDLKAYATRFAESQAAAGFVNLPSYENFPPRLVERLSRNGFQGGAVLGLSGNLLAAADMANYDFFRREQWRTCAAGAAFDRVIGGAQFAASELSLDTPSGRRGMNFAVPIKNGDGKTGGGRDALCGFGEASRSCCRGVEKFQDVGALHLRVCRRRPVYNRRRECRRGDGARVHGDSGKDHRGRENFSGLQRFRIFARAGTTRATRWWPLGIISPSSTGT